MAMKGKHQKQRNVTEGIATASTPGPTIHRIQIPAVSDVTTSESDMASVSTAELENLEKFDFIVCLQKTFISAFIARNLLAAFDHNSHIDRDVIVNTNGTIRYQRSFNKNVRDGLQTQRKLINSTCIFRK